jgi:chemotaxis protein MotA
VFPIIGIVVVFGAVIAGYLLEHGNLKVLMQPAELLIIGGAALGTLLIGNPPHIVTKILKGLAGAFGASRFGKKLYAESLKMLYELFTRARKEGLPAVEADCEDPEKAAIFQNYKNVMKDYQVRDFICDTMRSAASGAIEPFDIDQLMEADLDIHHHDAQQPISALSAVADALPGLGIVAAVLGVVITMGALGGPPEEIGHKVAAALVGTFLGIFLCYGMLGPLAANMAKTADEEHAYYQVLRVSMAAFIKGTPPIAAVEVGRRAVPGHVRPSFKEFEKNCRNKAAEAPAKAEAA